MNQLFVCGTFENIQKNCKKCDNYLRGFCKGFTSSIVRYSIGPNKEP